MIVKIVPAPKGGTGRRLGEYVLDLKHDGEKVEWSRTINTGAKDAAIGLEVIEAHNALNTNTRRAASNVHMVVSFPPEERLSRQLVEYAEDRLVASIRLDKHPRLSALHRDRDHTHLHVVVSRIEPETYRAVHLRHDYYRLQAEGKRLERELGLTQTRHTLLEDRTPQARLERARNADRVPSGWRELTVEDVAAESSNDYANAREALRAARERLDEAQRRLARGEQDQAVALHRMEERKREVGVVRAWLHDKTAWHRHMSLMQKGAYYALGDAEIDRWRGGYRGAGKRLVEAKADLRDAAADVTKAEDRMNAAFAAVQSKALVELERRRQIARDARREKIEHVAEALMAARVR